MKSSIPIRSQKSPAAARRSRKPVASVDLPELDVPLRINSRPDRPSRQPLPSPDDSLVWWSLNTGSPPSGTVAKLTSVSSVSEFAHSKVRSCCAPSSESQNGGFDVDATSASSESSLPP